MTARRLILAAIQPGDPGLAAITEWNASVYNRTKEDTRHD